ncbi:molybdopterin-guanine dinucleotide biosynthesis protein B [Paenibacillus sp. SYP-B3998]|uniref:Molybdopterin-guanine dinucleotide biosynthesis protein B n=1 Tax=Paenibacillus sp. SYP-B3998 TaxID=2678564 RepID=A0A6G4A2V1_9BACL|nr:molybdopterin-guanine dinucleotide biosynthesis protein B [Paenibacillus sp. SYP-B3998]NEW08715.1 molybdopterin-guanine dinucleotide biosynthesis protein B [Paenibacillus sp. SYP-B3998]
MAHYIGFAGFSNSGKTTFIAKLIGEMKRRGYLVGVMKHDAHGHYKEAKGADSSTFIQSGADAVATLSPDGVHVYEKKSEPNMKEQLAAFAHLDYVIIEGFKKEKHPKIAIFRTIEQSAIMAELDSEPLAIVTDLVDLNGVLPSYKMDEVEAVATFIVTFFEARQY